MFDPRGALKRLESETEVDRPLSEIVHDSLGMTRLLLTVLEGLSDEERSAIILRLFNEQDFSGLTSRQLVGTVNEYYKALKRIS